MDEVIEGGDTEGSQDALGGPEGTVVESDDTAGEADATVSAAAAGPVTPSGTLPHTGGQELAPVAALMMLLAAGRRMVAGRSSPAAITTQ